MTLKIVIKNNLPRVIGIGACLAAGISHGEIRLIPGANVVDAEEWKRAKGSVSKPNKILAGYIDRDEIEEGDSSDDADSLPSKPTDAIKRVKETLDMRKLRAWAEVEKRAPVLNAITKQIAEIDSREKKPDEAGATE